jgi:hypothetical protein
VRVQVILESDLDQGERPPVMALVPLPTPEEREQRILKSLAGSPGLQQLLERIAPEDAHNNGARPFWPR